MKNTLTARAAAEEMGKRHRISDVDEVRGICKDLFARWELPGGDECVLRFDQRSRPAQSN